MRTHGGTAPSHALTDRVDTDKGTLTMSGDHLKPMDKTRASRLIDEAAASGIERLKWRRLGRIQVTLVTGHDLDWTFTLGRHQTAIGGGRRGLILRY